MGATLFVVAARIVLSMIPDFQVPELQRQKAL
jgi:hypothetical protein